MPVPRVRNFGRSVPTAAVSSDVHLENYARLSKEASSDNLNGIHDHTLAVCQKKSDYLVKLDYSVFIFLK
jgi:hypothetical protein